MATYLNFPYDAEIFNYNWQNFKDTTTEALFNSGAVVNDAYIAQMIAKGSDLYTIPAYKPLSGTPENYDGATNLTASESAADSMTGVVYGRGHGFVARDFIGDFNSGADPMKQIANRIGKWRSVQNQVTLLSILNGIFGITGVDGYDLEWLNHTSSVAVASGNSVAENNLISETTIGEALQKAVGDFSNQFSLAIMHSKVANRLAKLEVLNYWKYTDANGIERRMNIGDINGLTVIVDDGVPVTTNPVVSSAKDYTTYLFGAGAVRTADAPVEVPSEVHRDPATNGGQETLYVRWRKTIHPNGFSFAVPTEGYTKSPTNTQLATTAQWSIKENPKNIAIARVITNG